MMIRLNLIFLSFAYGNFSFVKEKVASSILKVVNSALNWLKLAWQTIRLGTLKLFGRKISEKPMIRESNTIIVTVSNQNPVHMPIVLSIEKQTNIQPEVNKQEKVLSQSERLIKDFRECSDEWLHSIIRQVDQNFNKENLEQNPKLWLLQIQQAISNLARQWSGCDVILKEHGSSVELANTLKIVNWIKDRIAIDFAEALVNELSQASELPNLLDASNNKMQALEEWVKANQSTISEMKLSNDLKVLPNCIGEFKSLQKLDLSNNLFQTLPESFSNLVNLEHLIIIDNQFQKIPNLLGKLTKLQTLDFSRNSLDSLSEILGDLINLKILRLANNQLRKLPEAFKNLTNLCEIDLSNNWFEAKPEVLDSLKNLKKVNLEDNLIEDDQLDIDSSEWED